MWGHPGHLYSPVERVQEVLKAAGFAHTPFLGGIK